jgi:hypothetical protein
LCIHDARNFDEYTQVLAGDTTNKMTFLGGEEGAALCIALLCTPSRQATSLIRPLLPNTTPVIQPNNKYIETVK